MRTVVHVLESVRDQLVKVYVDRVPVLADALLRAIADLEEIERVLTTNRGLPPGAVARQRGTDGVWWMYSDGLWVGLTIRDINLGWPGFGRWVRTITVVAVGPPAGA